MKVRLIFDAQFCGHAETIVTVPDDVTNEYIESLFEPKLGVPFDKNCYFQIIKDKDD